MRELSTRASICQQTNQPLTSHNRFCPHINMKIISSAMASMCFSTKSSTICIRDFVSKAITQRSIRTDQIKRVISLGTASSDEILFWACHDFVVKFDVTSGVFLRFVPLTSALKWEKPWRSRKCRVFTVTLTFQCAGCMISS